MLRLWRWAVPAGTPRPVRVNLAIVLAFALVAVGLLTRTLVTATQIDDDIAHAVNPQLVAIGSETVRLPVLDETKDLVEDIATAAEPLHPSLAAAERQVADIRATHHDIVEDTLSIGTSVGSIDGSVASIRAALEGVGPVAAGIRDRTREVGGALATATGLTRGLRTSVDAVADVLAGLAGRVAEIDGTTAEIRTSVHAVRGHTARIADAGLLRLAELLAAREDLVQTGNIAAAG